MPARVRQWQIWASQPEERSIRCEGPATRRISVVHQERSGDVRYIGGRWFGYPEGIGIHSLYGRPELEVAVRPLNTNRRGMVITTELVESLAPQT